MSAAPLYVEARISADIDELWAATQDPAQHQRWDLRFTHIDYLDSADGGPQRFTYAVRVLGIKLSGTGICAGENSRPDGSRTSALRFASPHPLSLLAQGSGYWRYVPTEDGIRFLTGYDYRPRWGRFGRIADRLIFRPLIGWATAWSFDRLRLWLERGTPPEHSLRRALLDVALRSAVLTAAAVVIATRPRMAFTSSFAPLDGFAPYIRAIDVLTLAAALLLLPPLPGTPAARRCIRRQPAAVTAPAALAALDHVEPLA